MSEKLSPERAVRLLRAKAAELEGYYKLEMERTTPPTMTDPVHLAADVALIAGLLADEIERADWGNPPEDEA